MSSFNNIIDFVTYFKDDLTCRQHLELLLWDNRPVCPHCGNEKHYRFSNGKHLKCATCKVKYTVTVGTIFDSSKIPLKKWFLAMYIASSHKKGISSNQLAKDIGVTQKTAWFLLQRILEGARNKKTEIMRRVVEIDEAYMNKKNNVTDRPYTSVIGAVDRYSKTVTTKVLDKTTVNSHDIITFARENIAPKTILLTDSSSIYDVYGPQGLHSGTHRKISVNHKENEFSRGKVHTNTIEGFFGFLKWTIEGTHKSVSRKHMQAYSNGISFRYNTREDSEAERFDKLISRSVTVLRHKDLVYRGLPF